MAVLSLCESCAVSIRNFNETNPRTSEIVTKMVERLEQAAKEARGQWPTELTRKEADKIVKGMGQADLVTPEFRGNLAEHTAYYTSLALGLLDELFKHIRDAHKLEHLERVEKALRELCNYFDRNLDRFAIYEHASRAIPLWLECFNG